jgi:hypothetical protein
MIIINYKLCIFYGLKFVIEIDFWAIYLLICQIFQNLYVIQTVIKMSLVINFKLLYLLRYISINFPVSVFPET